MSSDDRPFDPHRTLAEYAEHLNAIRSPGRPGCFTNDVGRSCLVRRDECSDSGESDLALRFLVAYRTGIMLDKPRNEFKALWEYALSLFPQCVGFCPERRQPTPELLKIYRRGEVRLRKCLRDMERQLDVQANEGA